MNPRYELKQRDNNFAVIFRLYFKVIDNGDDLLSPIFSTLKQRGIVQGKNYTQQKANNLFRVNENSIEQCCAAHIVQSCQKECVYVLDISV